MSWPAADRTDDPSPIEQDDIQDFLALTGHLKETATPQPMALASPPAIAMMVFIVTSSNQMMVLLIASCYRLVKRRCLRHPNGALRTDC